MTAFDPWPALAPFAKTLDGLFYYDVPPIKMTDAKAPLLVLIHGLGDEADSWRHLIPRLRAAGYRTLAPDLPGFGRSAAPRGSSLGCHVRAITALLNAVNVRTDGGDGTAVLIGSSMGAAVAELTAVKSPDSKFNAIAGLILLDGFFPSAFSAPLLLMALPYIGKKWYRAFRKDPEGAWKSLFPFYADIEALPEEDKAFLKRRVMDRVMSPSQERAYFASLRSMIGMNLFNASGLQRKILSLPSPVHVIWGEKDLIVPYASGFSIIAGAGHLPHQEKPEETAKILLGFLEMDRYSQTHKKTDTMKA
jgi:pimeloyl-ACP methyl ester carboxylesterase